MEGHEVRVWRGMGQGAGGEGYGGARSEGMEGHGAGGEGYGGARSEGMEGHGAGSRG